MKNNFKVSKSKIGIAISSGAVLISGCATVPSETINNEKVSNASIVENKKLENKLTSVVNLEISKYIPQNVEAIALPETKEIVFSLNGISKDFSDFADVKNDPLIEDIFVREVSGKFKLIIRTKQNVSFESANNNKYFTIILKENDFFKYINSGEVFKIKHDLNNISSNWVKVEKKETESAFLELKKFNLKKNGDKNARLSFEFNNEISPPEMKKEKDGISLEFKDVIATNKFLKKINASSVETIIKDVSIHNESSNMVVKINIDDKYETNSYNLGDRFVVEIKNSENQNENIKYQGKKLSMSFQDMEVRAILQVIADFTSLNLISSDAVSGSMSIRLKDVPWDQALDLILESRGLQKVKDGNVIWIATREEVEKNNQTKINLLSQNIELEPLKLEFFQINYYKAEELKSVLEANNKNSQSNGQVGLTILSKRGSIGVDARNNMLFIQDTEERLKEIKKIIKKLDIANRQVLVEAKIVIADKKFGQDIGTKFGINYTKTNGNGQFNAAGTAGTNSLGSSLAAGALNGAAPGAIGITLLNLANQNLLNLELSAIEDNNRGKVISNPRLLTADNKKATIEQGSEIPYTATSGTSGGTTVEFKKASLKLDVTPQIAPNGKIVLDLNISKDSIGQLVPVAGGGTVPSIDTKRIQTAVTVNNGQTVVLGGVYEIQNQEDIQKIPLVGDIPLFGNLFKRSVKNETKGELMIFITPFIVDNSDLDQKPEEKPNEINIL